MTDPMTVSRPPAQLLVATQDEPLARQIRALLAACNVPCTVLSSHQDCQQAPLCRWLQNEPLSDTARIHALLADAISVLEHSRHAFKSRELGQLRHRLSDALKELSDSPRVV
jgi:hypothetical protein